MTPVITVEHVYKQYQLHAPMRLRTIAQDIRNRLRPDHDPGMQKRQEQRYVLSDVSFSLEAGDSLGVIGHNGSGKSTLLRLLAGVSLPTKGRIQVVGRLSPMLSLGAGFHPELTGHENLHLNCTLMGLSSAQIRGRTEQMVDFADIGDYIDVPVKRYSSGMMARLGFAAAIHMEPEIILMDEVLAVGDYAFGVKSLSAIREFIRRGTLIFVSHDLGAVERICKNCLWLDQGQMRGLGPATQVIRDYTEAQQEKLVRDQSDFTAGGGAPEGEPRDAEGGQVTESAGAPPQDADSVMRQQFDPAVIIQQVTIHDRNGAQCSEFEIGEDIVLRCRIRFTRPMTDVRIVFGIVDIEYSVVVTAADNQQVAFTEPYQGELVVEAIFPQMKLRPRGFGVWVGISNPTALIPLATWKDIMARFYVRGERRTAELHYFAPQGDLVFTTGVQMRYIGTAAENESP